MFGVLFPDRSFPLDPSSFTQIDPLHYLLDITTIAGDSYHQIKTLCIFLLPSAASSLPSSKALAVYIHPPGSPSFLFCGAVHLSRPSAVLSLPWPDPADTASALAVPGADAAARIGVSVEDIAALPAVADAGAEGRIERMAMKVGENLFNFMQSFCGVDGSRLVVPMDILDRWFKKFQERARRDPSYLKEFAA